jgi:hypothetical protein
MMDFVSWDDEIPNCMESHEIPWFQTTNQHITSGLTHPGLAFRCGACSR